MNMCAQLSGCNKFPSVWRGSWQVRQTSEFAALGLCWHNFKWKRSEKSGFKQLVFTVKIELLETRASITDKKAKMLQWVSRNYIRVSICLFRLSLPFKRSALYVEVVCPSVCVRPSVDVYTVCRRIIWTQEDRTKYRWTSVSFEKIGIGKAIFLWA